MPPTPGVVRLPPNIPLDPSRLPASRRERRRPPAQDRPLAPAAFLRSCLTGRLDHHAQFVVELFHAVKNLKRDRDSTSPDVISAQCPDPDPALHHGLRMHPESL